MGARVEGGAGEAMRGAGEGREPLGAAFSINHPPHTEVILRGLKQSPFTIPHQAHLTPKGSCTEGS